MTYNKTEIYIEAPDNLDADFCYIASGDCMIGANIFNGDVVFIKQQETVENGQIAAVKVEDTVILKRWYYYPEKETLVLMPENPKYKPMIFSGERIKSITCIGRAVGVMSKL